MSDWEEESQPPVGYNPEAGVEKVRGKFVCVIYWSPCLIMIKLGLRTDKGLLG